MARGRYETSLFAKLSLAYVFNSAIMPLAIGMFVSEHILGKPVNQSFYEPGGVVETAIFLILSSAVITEILKVVQVGTPPHLSP